MNNYGIIINREKDIDLKYTRNLVDSILKRSGKVNIVSDVAKELGLNIEAMTETQVYDNSEMLICLGGDGTLLRVARKAFSRNIPILGINLGTLGFLTEVDKNDIDGAIEKLFKRKYNIEERIMLETVITNNAGEIISNNIALNDITVSRVALSRILHLKMYVNGSFIDSFPGDGVIISSPTGSTAYSMSAGGPIVEPDMDLMILTPICPHILYSRSFIIKGDSKVKVIVEDNYINNAMVTLDGQKGYRVSGGYTIEIYKSSKNVRLVRMNKRNFFNVLRTKIYDRGEKLREDEV